MPAPPGVMRGLYRRWPWLADAVVAGSYAVVALTLAVASTYDPVGTPIAAPLGLFVAGIAVILFRHRAPIRAWCAAAALCLVSLAAGTGAEVILVLVTLYAVGANRSARTAWLTFVGAIAGSALAATILTARLRGGLPLWEPTQPPSSADPLNDWINLLIPAVILCLVATLFGVNEGQRRRYVAALIERANQLARERDQQAEIASSRERERISREMHDIMAHSVSVMVSLSDGALASADDDPGESRAAVASVAETGRRTLSELRRLLGAVGSPSATPAEYAPQPGASDLASLVAEFRRAGVPAHLMVTGTPTRDAALGLTVYRIVQECLTNALRHAHDPTEVLATVTWRSETVAIVVENDGAPVTPRSVDGGRGLVGLRERAELYAGTVVAGPRDGGGWRVHVELNAEDP